MPRRYPTHLPRLWLVTDKRNDHVLERAIASLPRGSGVIFRHYHLEQAARARRFAGIARLCRRCGHLVILAGSPALARRWRADGSYGPPRHGVALATAHDLRELGRANRRAPLAVLLSPVFATGSHPQAKVLGRSRFLLLARRARVPVLALGGMTRRKARALPVHGWAAIDGLSAG